MAAARVKRWKDEDGTFISYFECLPSDGRAYGFFLAWDDDDGEGPGGRIGDENEAKITVEPTERDARIRWIVYNAAKPFADDVLAGGTLWFEWERKAADAVRAVNIALAAGCVCPDWAVKAKAAGWTPPAGWKP